MHACPCQSAVSIFRLPFESQQVAGLKAQFVSCATSKAVRRVRASPIPAWQRTQRERSKGKFPIPRGACFFLLAGRPFLWEPSWDLLLYPQQSWNLSGSLEMCAAVGDKTGAPGGPKIWSIFWLFHFPSQEIETETRITFFAGFRGSQEHFFPRSRWDFPLWPKANSCRRLGQSTFRGKPVS